MAGHQNRDPHTGVCLDCGCRREEIDDGVACEPVPPGPNRIAIIALKRELRLFDATIGYHESHLRRTEEAIPAIAQSLREALTNRHQMLACIERLSRDATGGAPGFDFGILAKLPQNSGY